MGFEDMLWKANVKPTEFSVGDEVCYYKSTAKDVLIVIAVRTTMTLDGDETYQEIMVKSNPYWIPSSQFVRVRKVS